MSDESKSLPVTSTGEYIAGLAEKAKPNISEGDILLGHIRALLRTWTERKDGLAWYPEVLGGMMIAVTRAVGMVPPSQRTNQTSETEEETCKS